MSVLVRLCVCVCAHKLTNMCVRVCTQKLTKMCVCICVHEYLHGAEVSVGCLLLIPTLCFKKEPLVGPRTHQLSSLTGQQLLGLSCLHFSVLIYRWILPHPALYDSVGDLNPCAPACIASLFPIEPSFQAPRHTILRPI